MICTAYKYHLAEQIEENEMGVKWHIWGRGEVYLGFWGKPERKRRLGRPRHVWEDNSKIDLQEVGWGHGLG
jgi:hypothetical protein